MASSARGARSRARPTSAVPCSCRGPASPGLAVVMLREPIAAGARGDRRAFAAPIATCRSSRWATAPHETAARAAGASDFLRTPTYIRDVVNVAKLNAYGDDGEGLLSEYHGLFYLLRAMSATARSCVLRLARGPRRAEIRFKDGKVVSASVRALQNLPALHHVLLWEEAGVSIAGGPSRSPASSRCRRRRSWTSASASCATSRTRRATSARPTRSTSRSRSRGPRWPACSPTRWCRCCGCSTASTGCPTSSRRARSGSSTPSG